MLENEEELDRLIEEKNNKERREVLEKLSKFVQDRIVPTDPVFYVVDCRRIDVAIEYYINIIERENKLLKKENEELKRGQG